MVKSVNTRLDILLKAFDLVHRQGFQATSIDEIIATTQVTKGAFFYHFKNKEEMGLALIREIMHVNMYPVLVQPLLNSTDPVKDIYKMMHELLLGNPYMQKYGCPANNLIQEMAPLNSSFSEALTALMVQWKDAIEKSIHDGKKSGLIRKEIHAQQVSNFIMSGYGGIRILGRLSKSDEVYKTYLKELKRYLNTLT